MMLRKLRNEFPVSPLRTTALVTGGAGFIGSHLCDRLVQSGYRVICLDNLYTGSIDNIRPLINHPAFTFIEHDVTEPLPISGPVQRIYNLACPASPPHYQRDPIGTMKTCVLGAYNVLELAREKGPRACYDEGKRAAEALFFDYQRMHGLQIKVARIFNTYGPRMMENDGRVVSNFIVQALRGESITVYGEGKQSRSFCYVDDLVEGLVRLMESDREITGPFNLGNPVEVTVEEIARRILAHTGAKSRLRYLPLPQDDPKRRKPVIDRVGEALGWSPRVDLDHGLKATIGYFALKLGSSNASSSAKVTGRRAPARSEREAPAY